MTPAQRACLTRKFRILKKEDRPQKQKIAIALRTCNIPRKPIALGGCGCSCGPRRY